MRIGDIFSTKDSVGVAVVNLKVPRIISTLEILENCNKIIGMIENLKNGYPGLDLVIFPEYSLQGTSSNIDEMERKALTIPGPETDLLSDTCKSNSVWGVFSIAGEVNPKGLPYNTMILIDDKGNIVQKYRKIMPWTPKELWTPGNEIYVSEGPKGIKISLLICDDSNYPELWRECSAKGAELVCIGEGAMYPVKDIHIDLMKSMSFVNNIYAAVSNLTGNDGTYTYFGKSAVYGFDGHIVSSLDGEINGVTYAELSISQIREIRKEWVAENHIYKLLHRGYSGLSISDINLAGLHSCPFEFYKNWVENPKELATKVERDTNLKQKLEYWR